MTSIVTKDMHVHMAEQFYESLTEEANTIYYVVASKSTEFDSDLEPPTPSNSTYGTLYQIYDEMIFGKHVSQNDVSHMVRYVPWESGVTYDMYDDKDEFLFEKDFFVVSIEPSGDHSIFKCIYNGKKVKGDVEVVPKTFDQPLSTETHAGDNYYRTADGYVWKLMCVINRNEFEKFATKEFMPVKVDPAISGAAIDGAIEHILVENSGSSYNAYAFGSIKQSAVAGNNMIFALQTDELNDILTFDVLMRTGAFVSNHNQTERKKFFFRLNNNTFWSVDGVPVTAEYYHVNNTIVRVIMSNSVKYDYNVVSLFQTNNNLPTGTVVAEGEISAIRRDLIPTLSSNSDFYTNSSFYIRSGTGAGNLRYIVDYIVVGNDRRVLLDRPFPVLPDSTSRFEIGPRVLIRGDGTSTDGTRSASAIAIMEESSNTIHSIEIIDPGKAYTYANVEILSNTGYVDSQNNNIIANTAQTRVIISPKGGHGKSPIKELGGKYICVSAEFDNASNSKIPSQNDYRSVAILKDPLFNRLSLTLDSNSLLFNDGETVVQFRGGATGEVYNRSGNTLTLKNIRGFFNSGEEITTVRGVNDVTAEILNLDKNYDVADQRSRFAINMTNMGSLGTGFLLDEFVRQPDTNAVGYVHAITDTRIDLVQVRGTWNTSDDSTGYIASMVGDVSGASAKITAVEPGDFVDNSGEFLYVEHFTPIQRMEDQKEQIKIVMEF